MDKLLQCIDELESLVENSKVGFMGQRMVNEEEFFTIIQRLRTALVEVARANETRGASPAASEIISQTHYLTPQEQLQIIAALARRLAGE